MEGVGLEDDRVVVVVVAALRLDCVMDVTSFRFVRDCVVVVFVVVLVECVLRLVVVVAGVEVLVVVLVVAFLRSCAPVLTCVLLPRL